MEAGHRVGAGALRPGGAASSLAGALPRLSPRFQQPRTVRHGDLDSDGAIALARNLERCALIVQRVVGAECRRAVGEAAEGWLVLTPIPFRTPYPPRGSSPIVVHIVSNKPYMSSYCGTMLDAIEAPTWVLRGYGGAMAAALSLGPQTYLHVVYREVGADDGFIVTAFLSRTVNRRQIIWPERS